MNDDLDLVPGSRYRVMSLASREEPMVSEGTFRGFASIGTGVFALVLEMDDGTRRLIPTHMLLSIDILSVPDVVKTDEGEAKVYFR